MIGIGIIIILAAAYLFMNQNKVAPSNYSAPDVSKIVGSESLSALMAKGKPLQCDIVQDSVKSKFYIANKKIRTNFTTTTNGTQNIGHMIMKDNTSYTWMDGEAKGFKVSIDAAAQQQAQTQPQANQKVDLNSKVDYTCASWTNDDTYFNLPPNVEFTDLSATMKIQTSGGADLKAIQCAACDSAPAASRAQCKAALGCK